jgi:hypothetical protein
MAVDGIIMGITIGEITVKDKARPCFKNLLFMDFGKGECELHIE